jgi:hypothetical protein
VNVHCAAAHVRGLDTCPSHNTSELLAHNGQTPIPMLCNTSGQVLKTLYFSQHANLGLACGLKPFISAFTLRCCACEHSYQQCA